MCLARARGRRWLERHGKLGKKVVMAETVRETREASDDELDRKASVWLEQMGLR